MCCVERKDAILETKVLCYSDDTQLYFAFKSRNPDDLAHSKSKVEAFVSDVISWMTVNRLKINSDKTEFLILLLTFLHVKSGMHQFYPNGQ